MTGLLRDPVTGETFRFWSRADWGAAPPRAKHPMSSTRDGIFVHHTVTGPGNVPATLRGIQSYHQHGRGWLDIGYSFCVGLEGEWDGDIFEARGWWVQGGHTENRNSTSHAISLVGNTNDRPGPGEPPYSPVSDRAKRAVNALIRVAEERYGPQQVRCHGDVAQTGCPGSTARAWVHAGHPADNHSPTPPPPASDEDTSHMDTLITDGREGRLSAWLLSGRSKTYIADPGLAGLLEAAAKAGEGDVKLPPTGALQGHGSPWIARLDLAALTNPHETPEHLGGAKRAEVRRVELFDQDAPENTDST